MIPLFHIDDAGQFDAHKVPFIDPEELSTVYRVYMICLGKLDYTEHHSDLAMDDEKGNHELNALYFTFASFAHVYIYIYI